MKKKRFMSDEELVKKWKKDKWYSPEGEKIAIAAYKYLEEEEKKNPEPFDFDAYCNNIREAFKSLADFCEGITEAKIIEGDVTEKNNKGK